MVTRLGRFEIVSVLGKGSVGVVYRAYDPKMDRLIALKVLREDRITNPAYRDRFLDEAKVIGKLTHPNIVTGYDIGEDSGTIYIAMELLDGQPLNEVIGKQDFSVRQIVDIGIQVALALDYAHEKGIVHRDIKPSNLILDPKGQVKITDFSIAHFEDPGSIHRTQAGEILGTPGYMSPEQVLGKAVSGRADFFSLGIILYELATGERPFKGSTITAVFNAITNQDPPDPVTINDSLPESLSLVIMKCLEKDPERRFETGKELGEALQQVLIELDRGPTRIDGGRKNRWKNGLIGAGLVLFFAVVASYFYVIHKASNIRDSAMLKIASVPENAVVMIDKQMVGQTPLSIQVSLGKHEITVSKKEYLDWECQVNAHAKMEIPLQIELVKAVEATR